MMPAETEMMEGSERQKQVQKELGALVAGLTLLEEDMRNLRDALVDVLTEIPTIDETKVAKKDEEVLVPLANSLRSARITCDGIRNQISRIKKRLEV